LKWSYVGVSVSCGWVCIAFFLLGGLGSDVLGRPGHQRPFEVGLSINPLLGTRLAPPFPPPSSFSFPFPLSPASPKRLKAVRVYLPASLHFPSSPSSPSERTSAEVRSTARPSSFLPIPLGRRLVTAKRGRFRFFFLLVWFFPLSGFFLFNFWPRPIPFP